MTNSIIFQFEFIRRNRTITCGNDSMSTPERTEDLFVHQNIAGPGFTFHRIHSTHLCTLKTGFFALHIEMYKRILHICTHFHAMRTFYPLLALSSFVRQRTDTPVILQHYFRGKQQGIRGRRRFQFGHLCKDSDGRRPKKKEKNRCGRGGKGGAGNCPEWGKNNLINMQRKWEKEKAFLLSPRIHARRKFRTCT